MRLVSLMPTPKVQGVDEIIYRCDRCKVEFKRVTKRLPR
jgi:hypothetical protein